MGVSMEAEARGLGYMIAEMIGVRPEQVQVSPSSYIISGVSREQAHSAGRRIMDAFAADPESGDVLVNIVREAGSDLRIVQVTWNRGGAPFDYEASQLAAVRDDDAKVKLTSWHGNTKWLNLNPRQLAAIKAAILDNRSAQ